MGETSIAFGSGRRIHPGGTRSPERPLRLRGRARRMTCVRPRDSCRCLGVPPAPPQPSRKTTIRPARLFEALAAVLVGLAEADCVGSCGSMTCTGPTRRRSSSWPTWPAGSGADRSPSSSLGDPRSCRPGVVSRSWRRPDARASPFGWSYDRLDREQVAALATATLGRVPEARIADSLFERSEGLPLYVAEALVEPSTRTTRCPTASSPSWGPGSTGRARRPPDPRGGGRNRPDVRSSDRAVGERANGGGDHRRPRRAPLPATDP